MDSMNSKVRLLYEMCKYQNEFAEVWRKEQIEKRKEFNKLYLTKNYYGNSKEYKRDWAKNGAMINK
jgi:hypothetical protein